MDAKINSKVIPKTLAELIQQETKEYKLYHLTTSEITDYEVYPDDDGTDLKKNAYSRV